VAGLTWAEVDLDEGIAFVRETGSGDGPKSESGVRAVPLPPPVVQALKAWKAQQATDRLAWGRDWTDTGLVFTREDGTAVPGQWISVRFETLACRAGLPPVRFHDLRHGAASLYKAAGVDTKPISAMLGHSRTSFTDATYVLVFPEVAKAAAEAAAAVVPRVSGRADKRSSGSYPEGR
jgi:integrase